MATHNVQDTGFFAAVHQMLERKREESASDRRGTQSRHDFHCMQLIAPVIDGRMPDQSMFRRVQCLDLSQNGFAYLSPEPPTEESLIVALGSVPFTFLSAQVMHHRPIAQGSAIEYLVGCRFTGRLSG